MNVVHQNQLIVVRGAGEIASGVIWYLVKNDYPVIALEYLQPVCVRRFVCFANACYEQSWEFDGVESVLVTNVTEARDMLQQKKVPVLIDPDGEFVSQLNPAFLIDGRMRKRVKAKPSQCNAIVIGLGPGFTVGENCSAAIETNRGENLGKVIYRGSPEDYTGMPSAVNSFQNERVVRAPGDGIFRESLKIGDSVVANDVIGRVDDHVVPAQIDGVMRGLIHTDLPVHSGQKLGDIDPTGNRELCYQMSDKAQTVGLGVLEAVQTLS